MIVFGDYSENIKLFYSYQWINTLPSPLCLASEDREATYPSSETLKARSSSLCKRSSVWSKLPPKPGQLYQDQSSHSTPSTVITHPLSRMGRSDAFPRHRQNSLLGLRRRIVCIVGTIFLTQFFYSYNYNVFTTNIRYRTFRNIFPFFVAYIFADAYSSYRKQILKINLFDEYCYLRSQELVQQNEYMLDHPGTTSII